MFMQDILREFDLAQGIDKKAQDLHGDVPYHCFDHPVAALGAGLGIVQRCEAYGIPVKRKVVGYALLMHDAGYHEDHMAKGFNTKELYSAHLTQSVLKPFEPEEVIIEVVPAILATHPEAHLSTTEQKIVRAADLFGLSQSYSLFKENNGKLKSEYEMLNKTTISDKEWALKTAQVISFYLSQDIRLTPDHDKAGMSVFHMNTAQNLNRYLKEVV